ncbi:MAG: Ig-like domain-containing protein, partial [Pseudomonadota bacterium]
SDAPLTVTIAGANDSPDAVDDAFLIGRDQVLTGDVFDDNANGPDTDPDSGATFSVVAVDGLAANVNSPLDLGGGDTVRVLADGTLTYEQNGVFSGLAAGSTAQRTFTYTIRDDQGVEDTATATITITGNANNPVAVNDAYAIEENETINGDLLDGTGSGGTPDSDADPSDVLSIFAINGDQVSVGAAIELTAGSALTVNADGTFTYNPGTAFDPLPDGGAGQETFEYTVTDGLGGFDTGMVTIDVAGLNDAPDARDDDYGILEDDLQLSESVFTNNGDGVDLDVDAGSSFTVSAVDGDDQVVGTQITLASGALLTLNADGSFTYLPNGAFDTLSLGDNAEDTFEYTITDDQGDSDTATATVQISGENDAPIAADDSVTVSEGGTIDFDVITGSDTDVDQNDTLTVVEINGAAGPVGGTTSLGSGAQLTVNADGNVTYDPDGNFETLAFGESTTESFTYRISDGRGGTDIATVEVTIEGENDAPEVAALDATFTEDETGRQVDLLDAASITDIDASDDLDVQNVTVSGARTVDFTVDDETGLFDIDDGQFEDLAQGTSETFTIDYEVTDGIAIVANTATVTITGVNDAPEATALDDTFGEDETGRQVDLLDPASVSDVDAGTDLDVQNVQVTSPRGLTFTVDEETGLFDLADGQFEDLADGATETFTIDYEVTDGIVAVANTATITIEGANDAPDVLAIDETFGEDETGRQVALLDPASVSDVDMGDDLDVQNLQVTSPRALTFSLDAETGLFDLDDGQFEDLAVSETETFTIDYEVTDGIVAVSNSATITIVGANDQPDAVDDGGVGYFTDENNAVTVGSVLDNDTDADGSDVLTVLSVDTTGTLGQVTSLGNGLFDYDPNGAFSALGAGQTGTDTFEYTIGDGNGGTDTATVTVTIAGVGDAPGNIAPVFTSPSFIGTFENTAALLNIAVFDPDGPQPATFSLGGPDAALFNLDATTGALEFKAAPDFETPLDIGGTPGDNLYEISITADDGGVNGATTQGFVVEVFDVDETITIVGTPGYDRLQGSGADEVFQPLGGPLDVLYLGGGVDVVEFGPETSNGVRDVTYLYEFGADDFIDIGDRAIASEINAGGSTYLTLSGDFDLIAMIGTPDFTDDQLL